MTWRCLETGALVSRTRYFPYGAVRTQSGTPNTDRMYTGQRQETDTVYNYNARFYHVDVGRMPQADSIVPGAHNPAAYNRYAYVYNNPANYTDPTGHFGMGGVECMCFNLGGQAENNRASGPPAFICEVDRCGGLFEQIDGTQWHCSAQGIPIVPFPGWGRYLRCTLTVNNTGLWNSVILAVVDDLYESQTCGRAAIGVTSGLAGFFFFLRKSWPLRPPVASITPINRFMLALSAAITVHQAGSYVQNCY